MNFTAKLTVNFTSNYIGIHRICWRIGSSGPYDCSNTVSCSGGGDPCSDEVLIPVESDDCSPITIEGYVQAGCEDPDSEGGRIPFTVEFTPWEDCERYTVECTDEPCVEITPTDCAGTTGVVIAEGFFALTDTIKMCASGGPPSIPVGYSVSLDSPSTCVCDCSCYELSVTQEEGEDASILLYYTSCCGDFGSAVIIPGSPFRGCIVTGSNVWKLTGAGSTSENITTPCSEASPTCESPSCE